MPEKPAEKLITIAYMDHMDQLIYRSIKGQNVGYDIINASLIKVWENRETLIIPITRLISLIMHG